MPCLLAALWHKLSNAQWQFVPRGDLSSMLCQGVLCALQPPTRQLSVLHFLPFILGILVYCSMKCSTLHCQESLHSGAAKCKTQLAVPLAAVQVVCGSTLLPIQCFPYLFLPVILLCKLAPESDRIVQGLSVHLLIVLPVLDSGSGFVPCLYTRKQLTAR